MQAACACQVASNEIPGMLALYDETVRSTSVQVAAKRPYHIQTSAPRVSTNTLLLCFSKVHIDNLLFPVQSNNLTKSTIRGAVSWLI